MFFNLFIFKIKTAFLILGVNVFYIPGLQLFPIKCIYCSNKSWFLIMILFEVIIGIVILLHCFSTYDLCPISWFFTSL